MRWLDRRDTIYEIGGRATDISQIAYSLEQQVKMVFPLNKVPNDIVLKIVELTAVLEYGEKIILEFISLVGNELLDDK